MGISAGLMAKISNPDGTINMTLLRAVAQNKSDEFSAEAEALLASGLTGDKAAKEGYGDYYNRDKAAEHTLEALKNYDGDRTFLDDLKDAGKFVCKVVFMLAGGIFQSCDKYDPDDPKYFYKEGETKITTNITIDNRINVAINGAAAQSDPELKAALAAILAAIEDGNKLDKNNGDILDKILKKLESIDDRVKNLEDGVAALTANDEVKIDLLTQILAKIGNLEEGQKDMSDAAKTFYDTLLAKLDNMSAAQADFFTAVLSKLDNMSDAQANFYTALLAKMDNMSDVAIQKILDKMDVINATVEGMKEADAVFYAELLSKIGELGDKADTIIAKFEGLVIPDGGQPVDMSNVEDLLKQILDAVKANGDKIDVSNDKLEAIFNKIDGIPGKLDAIKEKLDTLSNAPDYTALLQEIRDKIKPCEGHDCDHTAVIDALLDIKILVEQIKDKIKEDTNDPHHEGILDDLDNIFG